MARAADPKLMMLDEPAAGLSRGERVALTDLLLRLDRDVTLLLIEHDMDVALRVAERVTMMHDGRVIVEGTPDEIKANQTVHDLYLGRAAADEPSRCSRSRTQRLVRPAHVLHGVGFEMGTESVALIGRNGMGKTTLCLALMGLMPRRDGSVRFDGKELMGSHPYQIAGAGIGFVPQGRRLFQSLTVDEHFRMLRREVERGLDDASASTSSSRASPSARTSAARSSPAASSRCSRSARALLTNPRLLIMDEPSEGLAPTIVDGLVDTVKALVARGHVGARRGAEPRRRHDAGRAAAGDGGAARSPPRRPPTAVIDDPAAQQRFLGVEPLADAA